MSDAWTTVPLRLTTDDRRGGRWTSLRAAGREWLWTNPDTAAAAARVAAVPGDAFPDAGGAEECIPTIRGLPDHGDAWAREWRGDPPAVELPAVGRLTRSARASGDGIVIDYTVTGRPGTPFLHAVHALLDVSQTARLDAAPPGPVTVLDPEPAQQEWPGGFDRLGPDDGTAACVLLPGCASVAVVDGDDALRFRWSAPGRDEDCSLVLWRNLRGWPPEAPYRSIGIEPMVGRAVDLGQAPPGRCALIGADGRYAWQLTVTALRRPGG